MKAKRVRLINSTLRDGVQALWSSRLSTTETLAIARTIDHAGYEAVDFMAPVQFDVSIRHLKENPWNRARAVRSVVQRTPLITHLRSRSLTNFDLVPDDVFDLWVRTLATTGFRRAMVFDALHDSENLRFSTERAKAAGLDVCVVLFYTISPFHTDDYYARKSRELASFGADAICIRDPSGLLTPERVARLVPAVRSNIGVLPLELKSHCTTGFAEECYVEAIRHGVDSLFVAAEPLANGASVPSIGRITARLRQLGVDTGVDDRLVADEAEYFADMAERTGRPVGRPVETPDASQYAHQIPGNMIAFTRDQLHAMKLDHLLPAVLEELPRVRADMGYPVMVTPVSQLVCVQAVLNVVQGERYKSIPGEVRRYVQGLYGKPDAPIDDVLRERAGPLRGSAGTASGTLDAARALHGNDMPDDDLLLHILFRPEQLAGIPMTGAPASCAARKPSEWNDLLRRCLQHRDGDLDVRRKGFMFSGRCGIGPGASERDSDK